MLTPQGKAKVEQAMENLGLLLHGDRTKSYSNEDLSVLYSVAYTLYQSDDYEEAIRVFQRLASHESLSQRNWMGLGACWQMQKNYQEALKAWAMASILNEHDPIPHLHAAECYFALENEIEGRKAMDTCKSYLKAEHSHLLTKLEELDASWKQEEQKGA